MLEGGGKRGDGGEVRREEFDVWREFCWWGGGGAGEDRDVEVCGEEGANYFPAEIASALGTVSTKFGTVRELTRLMVGSELTPTTVTFLISVISRKVWWLCVACRVLYGMVWEVMSWIVGCLEKPKVMKLDWTSSSLMSFKFLNSEDIYVVFIILSRPWLEKQHPSTVPYIQ